mmetsp:Transcript_11401/g.12774  ORF Transcript_11401/g.12774 Transcript_11401/m.12774 type:complete len:295 (-) Transcript_11401:191-1075(-)
MATQHGKDDQPLLQSSPVWPLMSPEEWQQWDQFAEPPQIYDPPQKRDSGTTAAVYKCLRSSCCGCARCVRLLTCGPCCGFRSVRILDPSLWFVKMLQNQNPTCPELLKGIWWLQDNVAAEGLLTFQDGQWFTPQVMVKSAKYNWTVDAYNWWGLILSANFWIRGGIHQFEVSPNSNWINIKVQTSGSDWIYVIQPGDVFRRPDGTVLQVIPGEDLMRISYETMDTNSPITYQYLVRRVAFLDAGGNLVKTQRYAELAAAARQPQGWCCELCEPSLPYHIEDTQSVTYAPQQSVM